jgi:hypothetical protein
MKKHLSSTWLWVLLFVVVSLVVGCLYRSSSTSEAPVAAEVQSAPEADPTLADADEPPNDSATGEPTVNAPFKPVSDDLIVPGSLRLTPAATEIVKLANAGLEEYLMLAFVTNFPGTFNLGSDEIIYLTDLGVSASVIKAMLLRDHIFPETPMLPPAAETGPNPGATFFATAPDPALPPQRWADVRSDGGLLPAATAIPIGSSDAAPDSLLSFNAGEGETAPASSVDDSEFYDTLAPYGNWVDVEGYGRCWQPTVAVRRPAWQPYFDSGHWVDSDCGWYWSSDYSWGWAPFHYGRWIHHATLNWCWVPDPVWGPSWVLWRTSDRFCGWAPLPPEAHFTSNAGLTFHGRPTAPNFHFNLAATSFHFVATNHFRDPHLSRYALARAHVDGFFSNTVAASGIRLYSDKVLNAGPSRNPSGAAGNTNAHTVALRPINALSPYGHRERIEGSGRTLAVFQPVSLPGTSANQTVIRSAASSPASDGLPQERRPAAGTGMTGGQVAAHPLSADVNRSPHPKPLAHTGGARSSFTTLSSASRQHQNETGFSESPANFGTSTPNPPPQPPSRSSVVVIGSKGGAQHRSPYVYFGSVPPQTYQSATAEASASHHSTQTSPEVRPATSPEQAAPVQPWWVPTRPADPQETVQHNTHGSEPAASHAGHGRQEAARPMEKPHHDYQGHSTPASSPVASHVEAHATVHSQAPAVAPAPPPHEHNAPAVESHSSSGSHDNSSSSHNNSSSGRR